MCSNYRAVTRADRLLTFFGVVIKGARFIFDIAAPDSRPRSL
jgi:hypothetical protein